MKISKLNALISKGRIQAIVKNVGTQRFLCGFERLSKRSRKYHVKHLNKPIDLAELSQEAQAKAQQVTQSHE
jgi:hypothetical protein